MKKLYVITIINTILILILLINVNKNNNETEKLSREYNIDYQRVEQIIKDEIENSTTQLKGELKNEAIITSENNVPIEDETLPNESQQEQSEIINEGWGQNLEDSMSKFAETTKETWEKWLQNK